METRVLTRRLDVGLRLK